jgi:hypothetical protein
MAVAVEGQGGIISPAYADENWQSYAIWLLNSVRAVPYAL